MSRVPNQIDYRRRLRGQPPAATSGKAKGSKSATPRTRTLGRGFYRQGNKTFGPDGKPLTLAQLLGRAPLPDYAAQSAPPATTPATAPVTAPVALTTGEFQTADGKLTVENGSVTATTPDAAPVPPAPLKTDTVNLLPRRPERAAAGAEEAVDMMAGVKENKRPPGHGQQGSSKNPNAELQKKLDEGRKAARQSQDIL
jgi:hypothetical protein